MFIAAIMSLDSVLKLSVEQLIRALNERLFVECKRVELSVPPVSHASVTKFTSEVRSNEPHTDLRVLT